MQLSSPNRQETEETEQDDQMETTSTDMIMTMVNRSQRDENLLKPNSRVKYDPDLMIKYLFDNGSFGRKEDEKNDTNVIKICKVKVTKTGGTMLAHYYARIKLANGYTFEFHPGSQPKTFQTVHSNGTVIMVRVMCSDCCKKELIEYVKGENKFNIAFQNCESILCKRKSVQTVLITIALLIVLINLMAFSFLHLFFILVIIVLLYINNNYMIRDPSVSICAHYDKKQTHDEQRWWKW
uniref:Ac81 n=1 Tax=Spodoptera littoralis nuclear polyhedrosis virus TaxID=10456 RepID=A0A3G4S8X3_NPVSL|nr:hypothetical protein [Spodoptera littoralis nucleopolyhedrovirus]